MQENLPTLAGRNSMSTRKKPAEPTLQNHISKITPRLSKREERRETAGGTARSADTRQPTPQSAPQHHAGVAAVYALVCLIAALLAYDHQARRLVLPLIRTGLTQRSCEEMRTS